MKDLLAWLREFFVGCFAMAIIFLGFIGLTGLFGANQSTWLGLWVIFIGAIFFPPLKKIEFLEKPLSIDAKYKVLASFLVPIAVFSAWRGIENFNKVFDINPFDSAPIVNTQKSDSEQETTSVPRMSHREQAANYTVEVIKMSNDDFDVGNFCLKQESTSPLSFEECLALSGEAISRK